MTSTVPAATTGPRRAGPPHQRNRHLDQHRDRAAAQRGGGRAGLCAAGRHQLNCTGGEPTLANIQAAIKAGVLSEGVIDNALVHLFTMRMETGEFDPASKVAYTKITKAAIQSPAHQALAEKVAAEDLVLLKNDNVDRRLRAAAARQPGQAEQRGHRRQPGEHGHPGRLLRRPVAPGERGPGHHVSGQGSQPGCHGRRTTRAAPPPPRPRPRPARRRPRPRSSPRTW